MPLPLLLMPFIFDAAAADIYALIFAMPLIFTLITAAITPFR